MCGSFCTLRQAVDQMKILKDLGADITPIMSPIVYSTDTRFGNCADYIKEIEDYLKNQHLHY